jgi:ferrous iron transport protein B
MFNLFTPPCFAAIGAMNSEMKSSKWLWGGIGLQFGIGYTVSYIVYTLGTLITSPTSLDASAALAGLAIVAVFVAVICVLIANTEKKMKAENSLKSK